MVASKWIYPKNSKTQAQKAKYRATHYKNGKKKTVRKPKVAKKSTVITIRIPKKKAAPRKPKLVGPKRPKKVTKSEIAKARRCLVAKRRASQRLALTDKHLKAAESHKKAAAKAEKLAERKSAHAAKALAMKKRNC